MIARIVVGLGLTHHDPCFLGRHNTVFIPPRQILEAVPGVTAEEMHRCKNRVLLRRGRGHAAVKVPR